MAVDCIYSSKNKRVLFNFVDPVFFRYSQIFFKMIRRRLIEEKNHKLCEFCGEDPATVLCAECCKCYCGGCSDFAHSKASKKGHKVEIIPDEVVINAMCPLHKTNSLELFCINEVKLCCLECEKEKLHQGYKVVKTADIAQDNEVFSASKVWNSFTGVMEKDDELAKKVNDVIETIDSKGNEIKERITKTFAEERKKLNREEEKIMAELEKAMDECKKPLEKYLNDTESVSNYSKLLKEVHEKGKSMSRLMELNLVSKMEEQRKTIEELHMTEMTDLKIGWDSEERKLSFTKALFNGAPIPTNIKFSKVTEKGLDISWDCDVSKIGEKSMPSVAYVVEMKEEETVEWEEVYSGKDKKCSIADLENGTRYTVRVKCTAGKKMDGKWSECVVVKTVGAPVPSNLRVKKIGLDIILTWDPVEGASFYQIEVDGSKYLNASTTNELTKRGLLPDTEYSFRVCAVKGNLVGEWSDVVRGRTQKSPTNFSECVWEKCPDDVDAERKYSVDEKNPRIATMNGDYDDCTIIGNTPLPINKVTSWNIKILKSRRNDGSGILIGVAPFDIDQNEKFNYYKCGWYFDCCHSELFSGPPLKYWNKPYGPRKGDGKYVHTGDSVGVVMDTAKGKLSLVLDGVNLGVAFYGIPLDKPLVPCVLLHLEGDSIELII